MGADKAHGGAVPAGCRGEALVEEHTAIHPHAWAVQRRDRRSPHDQPGQPRLPQGDFLVDYTVEQGKADLSVQVGQVEPAGQAGTHDPDATRIDLTMAAEQQLPQQHGPNHAVVVVVGRQLC